MRFNLFVRFRNDEFKTALWPVCRDAERFYIGTVCATPASFLRGETEFSRCFAGDNDLTIAASYATSLRDVVAVEIRQEPPHDGAE